MSEERLKEMNLSEMLFNRDERLLDYITNLQQENDILNTNLKELQYAIDNIAELINVEKGMCIEDIYDKIKDYKQRIEKAVEYIEMEIKKQNEINDNWHSFVLEKALNILRGEDK